MTFAPCLGRSRVHFFKTVPREVDGNKIFAGFVRIDGGKGSVAVSKGNGDSLDSIFSPSGHNFHDLTVFGELIGYLTYPVHAGVDELDTVVAILIGEDIQEWTGVKTGTILGGHGRTRHCLLGRLFIVETDNDGFSGGYELASNSRYFSILFEVEAHFSLTQILSFVDKCQGIEAEHVPLQRTDFPVHIVGDGNGRGGGGCIDCR